MHSEIAAFHCLFWEYLICHCFSCGNIAFKKIQGNKKLKIKNSVPFIFQDLSISKWQSVSLHFHFSLLLLLLLLDVCIQQVSFWTSLKWSFQHDNWKHHFAPNFLSVWMLLECEVTPTPSLFFLINQNKYKKKMKKKKKWNRPIHARK